MDLDHNACYRAICARDARFDGRFFTAVKTTGVYCRPICPARTPRRENIAFYRSAAAAQEAGFRPCLRCRPETAPDLGAWRGTSNTVARALALIEMGAFDEAGVERLALRLGVGERHLPAIIARLRRLFDLAADPGAIGAALAEDPALAPLIAVRPGLRVPGAWDGFELAIRAVLGQQITVTGATSLAGKLVAAYGEPLAANGLGGLSHIFPRPERLAKADLSALGMPKRRAVALSALAAAVLVDPQIFGVGRNLEDAIVRLRALPGIGEWTAQYIAMRELREPDAFPAADIGLMRAMSDADGRRPGPRELLARAERWRPWRAYAAHHLWASSVPSHGARKNAAGRRAQTGPKTRRKGAWKI